MPPSRSVEGARSLAGTGEPAGPPSTAFVVTAYAVVVLLTVLLTLWGAFLVPFRVGSVLVPVSWLVVGGGNAALVSAGGRLAGRLGAALPAMVWLALALVLVGPRTEGDLVVPTAYAGVGLVGLGYLLVGALAGAVSYSAFSARQRTASSAAASSEGSVRR